MACGRDVWRPTMSRVRPWQGTHLCSMHTVNWVIYERHCIGCLTKEMKLRNIGSIDHDNVGHALRFLQSTAWHIA